MFQCSQSKDSNFSGSEVNFYVLLSIMSVSFIIQLHSRFSFVTLGRGSLGRIQDIGTTFCVGFLHAFDILLYVLLKEGKR